MSVSRTWIRYARVTVSSPSGSGKLSALLLLQNKTWLSSPLQLANLKFHTKEQNTHAKYYPLQW